MGSLFVLYLLHFHCSLTYLTFSFTDYQDSFQNLGPHCTLCLCVTTCCFVIIESVASNSLVMRGSLPALTFSVINMAAVSLVVRQLSALLATVPFPENQILSVQNSVHQRSIKPWCWQDFDQRLCWTLAPEHWPSGHTRLVLRLVSLERNYFL